MADRIDSISLQAISRRATAWRFTPSRIGVWVVALLLLMVGGCVWSLMSFSGESLLRDLSTIWRDPYYRHVTWFSFYQAALSTLLSVLGAVPLAIALSRRHFKGRSALMKLFSVTLVLPALIAVYGIIAIYGNRGLLAQTLAWFDAELPYALYGLNGILLAHVFFNLPYATRLLVGALESIPAEQQQLGLMLGMTPWQRFRWVEWPRLKQQLPQVVGLVYMLCFTSFATVMALGGGPKATTIELAIYQAIKFDFELEVGALLALWQVVLCLTLVLAIHGLFKAPALSRSAHRNQLFAFRDSALAKYGDGAVIGLACLFVLPPLGMVVWDGLHPSSLSVLSSSLFWSATVNSFLMALCSALIALSLAYLILHSARQLRLAGGRRGSAFIEVAGALSLVTPGLVISTGLFLWLREWGSAYRFAFVVVVLVNSIMALPFALKNLSSVMHNAASQYHPLEQTLGIRGWRRLWWVDLPVIKRALLHAFAVSFLLSLGDLSAIALFGSQDFMTLPLYLLQLLGSYQLEAAATVSLWLLVVSVTVVSLTETGHRRDER